MRAPHCSRQEISCSASHLPPYPGGTVVDPSRVSPDKERKISQKHPGTDNRSDHIQIVARSWGSFNTTTRNGVSPAMLSRSTSSRRRCSVHPPLIPAYPGQEQGYPRLPIGSFHPSGASVEMFIHRTPRTREHNCRRPHIAGHDRAIPVSMNDSRVKYRFRRNEVPTRYTSERRTGSRGTPQIQSVRIEGGSALCQLPADAHAPVRHRRTTPLQGARYRRGPPQSFPGCRSPLPSAPPGRVRPATPDARCTDSIGTISLYNSSRAVEGVICSTSPPGPWIRTVRNRPVSLATAIDGSLPAPRHAVENRGALLCTCRSVLPVVPMHP